MARHEPKEKEKRKNKKKQIKQMGTTQRVTKWNEKEIKHKAIVVGSSKKNVVSFLLDVGQRQDSTDRADNHTGECSSEQRSLP